jgi:ABC-type glycerol-3-phosphate transport system substrate-binding protein
MYEQDSGKGFSRRQFLKGLGAATAGLALGACGGESGAGSGQLTVIGWSDPSGAMKGLIERYTEETGNKAKYLEAPAAYPDLVAKYTNYLKSGYDKIDVYLIDDFTVGNFQSANWLLNLKPEMSQQELDAFAPQVQTYFRLTGVYRLPIFLGGGAFYYRKDILHKEGMGPPKTWDELISMGEELKAKYPDKWPWAPMASRESQDVNYTFQTILQGGGDPKVLNDEGSLAALQYMHDVIYKYKITPKDITTYEVDHAAALAKQGENITWWFFEDGPAEFGGPSSPIEGKFAFAPWPAGPGGSQGMVHAWGWSVSEFSQRKDQAIKFVKWATEPKQLEDFMVDKLALTPPRTEMQKDPEIRKKLPFIDYIAEQGDNLHFRVIDVANPLEVNNTIGKTGSYVLTGEKSVEEAANWGHDQMEQLLQS